MDIKAVRHSLQFIQLMSRLRNWCFTFNIPNDEPPQHRPSTPEPGSSPRDVLPEQPDDSKSELPNRRDPPCCPSNGCHGVFEPPCPFCAAINGRNSPPGDVLPPQPDGDGGEAPPACYTSQFITCSPDLRYAIWQLERSPTTGRLHLQGYLEFKSSMRRSAVKRFLSQPSCHLEGRRGSRDQAADYCRKEETRVAGPWTVGHWDIRPGKRSDLIEVADHILGGKPLFDLVEEYPVQYIRSHRGITNLYAVIARKRAPIWRAVEVLVYYGDTGTGKTRLAVANGEVPFYILPQGERLWFDGYTGQPKLIIDDFYGWIKYGVLLRMLDGHPFPCEIKGSFFPALWVTVVITSNKPPEEWYSAGLSSALQRRLAGNITHFANLVN